VVRVRVAIGAVVVLVAVATLSAQAGASAGALTLADIEAAIAFGEGHDVQPYRLRHAGRPDNPVVVGAVYTRPSCGWRCRPGPPPAAVSA
jgi:hypothetical protein